MGIQGSGKSEISRQLEKEGYVVASNDRSLHTYRIQRFCRFAQVLWEQSILSRDLSILHYFCRNTLPEMWSNTGPEHVFARKERKVSYNKW